MDLDLDQILDKVSTLEFQEKKIVTRTTWGYLKPFDLKDVLYITTADEGYLHFVKARRGGVTSRRRVKGTLYKFEKLLSSVAPHFQKSHKSYLVNTQKIRSVDKTPRGHYALRMLGLDDDPKHLVPLTRYFAPTMAELLGLNHLDHLEPFNRTAEKLRSWGLKSLGADEVKKYKLDEPKQRERFRRRYGIHNFNRDRLIRTFPEKTNPRQIDKARVIRNILYQVYQWLKWGVINRFDGSMRRIWYKYVGSTMKKLYPDKKDFSSEESDVYDYFNDFVELGIFTYKEFGFLDRYEFYRGIGERHPELMVFMEKTTVFGFPRRLARQYSTSFLVTSGQVPWLTSEYMSEDLNKVLPSKDTPMKVFTLTDLNPGGYSIGLNLKKRFAFHGFKNIEIIPVIVSSIYDDELVKKNRQPLISWKEYQKGSKIIREPVSSRDKKLFPLYYAWFYGDEDWKGVNDPRLIHRRKYKNYERVTLFGMELDALELSDIEEHFHKLIRPYASQIEGFSFADLKGELGSSEFLRLVQNTLEDPDLDEEVKRIRIESLVLNTI